MSAADRSARQHRADVSSRPARIEALVTDLHADLDFFRPDAALALQAAGYRRHAAAPMPGHDKNDEERTTP